MLEAIKQSCPDTDIIVCAISPVTRAEKARHPGFWQRPVFNRKLKKLAKKMSVTYLDYTDFLKDSKGYLKAAYATGDGYYCVCNFTGDACRKSKTSGILAATGL